MTWTAHGKWIKWEQERGPWSCPQRANGVQEARECMGVRIRKQKCSLLFQDYCGVEGKRK